MATLLDDTAVQKELDALPEWKREGKEISRVFAFKSYLDGIDFVRRVADLAEQSNHHPDMVVAWRKVTVSFSTHSAGGLTKLDFKVAQQVDKLLLA